MYYLIIIIAIIYIVRFLLKKQYNYWNDRGINGPKPLPIVGNFGKVIKMVQSLDELIKQIYYHYPDEKVVGFYRGFEPVLLIRDPEIAKQILVKDFHAFQDRGVSTNFQRFTNALFVAEAKIWKVLRPTMSPIFTSSKLKNMIPIIQECMDEYIAYVGKLVDNNIEHEIKSLKSKFTLQVIGLCAFGENLRAISDGDNKFGKMASCVLLPARDTSFWMSVEIIFPGIKKYVPKISDSVERLQDYFIDLVTRIMKDRQERTLYRKDFVDQLIELKELGKLKNNGQLHLVIDEIFLAAQALNFYVGGFDTSAATMSFLVHEMALHQDYQEKVYQELCMVYDKYEGKLTYEALNELKYLTQVFDATLRKYPLAGSLVRKSTVKYTLPGTNVTLEKGTTVFISILGVQSDPKYYINPDEFDPELFTPENKQRLCSQCVYLPFGVGPRNCVGVRFAKLQSMLGLAAFFKHFKVEPSEKTRPKLTSNPTGITLNCADGIWLKISRRQ